MAEKWVRDAADEIDTLEAYTAIPSQLEKIAAIIQRHYEAAKCKYCAGTGRMMMTWDYCPRCGGKGRIVP